MTTKKELYNAARQNLAQSQLQVLNNDVIIHYETEEEIDV